MEELAFLRMTRDQKFDVDINPETASSLLAQMVRLNRILQQINDFNVKAANSELDNATIMQNIENLSNQLDAWLEVLPTRIRDTRTNMVNFASQGLGRLFVTLYLGYYHYGQMLFYRFLHEDSHTFIPCTRYYANKCKQHAEKLCEILYASDEVPGCDVRYNMVGHVVVIASTVQIHSLLFAVEDANVALARTRLEKNFCILTRLRRLWPTLDICMDRLKAFHEACRSSADTSFCMDRWMVRFLVEFANPVSDQASRVSDDSSWTLGNIGITWGEMG
ncbi:hypothetical protein NUU61_003640 [Penicillium alfredii]|uniref:Uncharacterized protein n=1 Tax=Penicillium alfredii TaxID=1506179 RepID=A0A9W9FJS7_9EURO|nr:uncharacterized protein NUU61_003640 [Penicillium alfredii]KAJ5101418.1 hypothetical protein NUU61_003640 [Penicillium alfredii]